MQRPVTVAVLASIGVLGLALAGGGVPADESKPASGPAAEVAVDSFFGGAVVAFDAKTGKITLRYDFGSDAQKKDWDLCEPWPIAHDSSDGFALEAGRLVLKGNAVVRQVAEWDGDVWVTTKLIPNEPKDVGAVLETPDTKSDYATYSIGEVYFHKQDRKAGGDTGVMKFGKQYAKDPKSDFTGFRYLAFRRPHGEYAKGKPITFNFGREGDGKLPLVVEGDRMDGHELPPRMKTVAVAFYSIQSGVAFDDVVVTGTLSKPWLEKNHVALRLDKPLAPADGAEVVAPEVAALAADYASGKATAAAVVAKLKDPGRSDADRAALSKALEKGPKKALPACADLLADDDARVRSAGITVVKAMTGKSYGFEPKGPPAERAAAIGRFKKDLEDNPSLAQDG